MKLTTLLLLLSFLFPKSSSSQSYNKQNDKVLAYNLAINSIIGGIGGAINKKKGEKIGHAFLKNFLTGGLGGVVKYTAKYQTYYLRYDEQSYYAPLNRVVFFLGHSITMNASMNARTFENLFFNYMGINMNYQPYEKMGNRFSAKLSIGTIYSGLSFAFTGNKFNLNKSLEYGQLYFELNPNTEINGLKVAGLGSYNSFAIEHLRPRQPTQSVVPHEIIHTYQKYDYFALGSFYKKKFDSILTKNKLYNFTTKYIDYDYQFIFQIALYIAQPKPRYYKNFFEFEAEHFSSRRYLKR